MDFEYVTAKFKTKKHEDLPPKRMPSISYADGVYICKAEDGTVWVSEDSYTWRKADES